MENKFKGFIKPTYTQTPNQIFDQLLNTLNGSQLKVLLYIVRRTFGFKKDNDNISLSQIVRGIKKRDGTIQDYGTGLSLTSVVKAIEQLIEQNVIIKTKIKDKCGDYKPSNYSLNFIHTQIDERNGFKGFTIPNYTPVPDDIFDNLLSKLSGSELKILVFITRLTFGYLKERENISLNRMLNGIGIGKKTLLKGLKSLCEKEIIRKELRFSAERGYESTNYGLNLQPYPWGKKLRTLVVKKREPLGEKVKIQHKNIQLNNIQHYTYSKEKTKRFDTSLKEKADSCYKECGGNCICSPSLYLYYFCKSCVKTTSNQVNVKSL